MIDNFKALESMSNEEFAEQCVKETVGNLHSMKVFVGVAYEQCKVINTDLMEKMGKEEAPEVLAEYKVLYDKLITVMQNLENKYNILLEAIKGVPPIPKQ